MSRQIRSQHELRIGAQLPVGRSKPDVAGLSRRRAPLDARSSSRNLRFPGTPIYGSVPDRRRLAPALGSPASAIGSGLTCPARYHVADPSPTSTGPLGRYLGQSAHSPPAAVRTGRRATPFPARPALAGSPTSPLASELDQSGPEALGSECASGRLRELNFQELQRRFELLCSGLRIRRS
jgi:hypothetical protein